MPAVIEVIDGATVRSNGDEASPQPVTVTEQDAAALITILLKRGYFHENTESIQSKHVAFKSCNEDAHNVQHSKDDSLLIETNQQSYVIIEKLVQQFSKELKARGRWSIQDAANFTAVSVEALRRRIVPLVLAAQQRSTEDVYTVLCGANGDAKEIMTAQFLNDKTETLWTTLHKSADSGIMSLVEAAELVYSLPLDMTLDLLTKRISADNSSSLQILLRDNGARVLVSTSYLEYLKQRITEAFLKYADTPVGVKTIAKNNGWEVSWVMQMIKGDLALPGLFHGETYIPNNFIESKRQSVVSAFATNGCVTSHMCYTMFGILPSHMQDYVALSNSTACLVLDNSVVHTVLIVAPLIEAVQDAVETTGWLDLQLHLPLELLQHQTEDARTLVEDHVLVEVSKNVLAVGVACVQSDGALFFSQAMINAFTKSNLPSLINSYAKMRADQLSAATESDCQIVHATEDEAHISGKEKHKARNATENEAHLTVKEKHKARKASKSKHVDTERNFQATEYGKVLLDDIVKEMLQVHPDLKNLESSVDVLVETCNLAFCTDTFESLCAEAVRTELRRLQSEKDTIMSMSASRTNAVRGEDMEAAFQEPACFATACYMVQAKEKFLTYAVEQFEDKEAKNALKRDFLTGCCADFTSRVTQYALFKNDVDEGIFALQSDRDDAAQFYAPVDLAARSVGKVYLACAPEKAGNRCDPLRMLREELPGSAGVALARQWILCGGECYQGGVKPAFEDSGKAYTRPGDVNAFMTHVRDNCFTICGLPFSFFDKKSEKKFLNARRQRLTQLLEYATDQGTVLDVRIMLLYQLVKNMVVSGPLLRGPILRLLVKERKISDSVSAELFDLAEKLVRIEKIDLASKSARERPCLTKLNV